MPKNDKKYMAFTLVEMLLVVIILGLILPTVFSMFNFMTKANKEVTLRQTAIQQGYEFYEKLNVLIQDYTIDYEEYYNRKMVGCVKSGSSLQIGNNFKWNIGNSGYCTEFTTYGNYNSTNRGGNMNTGYHDIYYCSSVIGTEEKSGKSSKFGFPRIVPSNRCGYVGVYQSYGQYAALSLDVRGAVGYDGNKYFGDADDKDTGRIPVDAIGDPTNIQELYFISHDGKSRLYFRRRLANHSGQELQYKIQMLRLKGFDAGQQHNFTDSDNEGLYDGKIDTWACDTALGFVCNGPSIGGAYAAYNMPADVDDGRIDLTQGGMSMKAWNIEISPTTNSEWVWAEDARQINPRVKMFIVSGIYTPYYRFPGLSQNVTGFIVPIQTSFNMKDFYRN